MRGPRGRSGGWIGVGAGWQALRGQLAPKEAQRLRRFLVVDKDGEGVDKSRGAPLA